uniref:Gag-pol polyprotein n=1 Tax=Solanum tuberosum TaxID=4113 RepID=M1DAU7_SOLTU
MLPRRAYPMNANARNANATLLVSEFLFGVSDLVRTECRNSMLLEDMNICRLMTHAQHVEGDMIKEHAKDNKKARTKNYDYSQKKSVGGNRS